jgi:hypothetical protein
MDRKRNRNLVVALGIAMSFFAIPHLIDDFLFGIPAEFGLTNQTAQVLSGVFTIVLILVLVMAGREEKIGYYGTAFLALAGILKHIPRMLLPGAYWGGWFSEFLIYGLIISGLALLFVSVLALRASSDRSLKA